MATLLLKRTFAGFAAGDEAAADLMKRWQINDLVQVDVKLREPRSLARHRRYWALCALVYQNCDEFKSAAEVHLWLKLECGLTRDMVLRSTGEIVKVADSIAFDKMDAEQWSAYWKLACDVIHQYVLPGIDIAALENEIAMVAS